MLPDTSHQRVRSVHSGWLQMERNLLLEKENYTCHQGTGSTVCIDFSQPKVGKGALFVRTLQQQLTYKHDQAFCGVLLRITLRAHFQMHYVQSIWTVCQWCFWCRYGRVEFWDDLKKLYHMCGVEEREVAFLLTDSQITNEVFLGDVSNILNSGEVPGMICLLPQSSVKIASICSPITLHSAVTPAVNTG